MQKRKLTAEQVAEIRELGKTSIKRIDIARKYGISPQLVSTILRYGYDSRPSRDRSKMRDESNCWEDLARTYNILYRDEPISAAEAKSIHDIALKKIRICFDQAGLKYGDLV